MSSAPLLTSFVVALTLAACVDLTAGQGGGGDTASDDSSTADGGIDGNPFALQGAGCGTDPTTGVTLCLAVNACPDIVFDPDLWPECGFRIGPAGFDLQCLCEDELCPIGTPLTCEQIPALLSQQSQIMVCASRAEGRCVRPGTGTTETPATGSCDKACAQQCGGEFGCLEQCGCT